MQETQLSVHSFKGQLQKCGNDNIPNPHAGAAKLKDIDKY
jgi:hypothetical protein